MKERYLWVIGALAAAVLVLVLGLSIPFALDVGDFETGYERAGQAARDARSAIRSPRSAEQLCDALDSLGAVARQIVDLQDRREDLESRRSLIREVIRPLTVGRSQLLRLERRVAAGAALASEGAMTAAASEISTMSSGFLSARSVDAVSETLDRGRRALERIEACAKRTRAQRVPGLRPTVIRAFEEIDPGRIVRTAPALGRALDAGVQAISRIGRTENSQVRSRLERASTAEAVVAGARSHLDWLATARVTLNQLCSAGARPELCTRANTDLEASASRMKADVSVVRAVIDAQQRSSARMRRVLIEIDRANDSLRSMERFASSSQIRDVYRRWDRAAQGADESRSMLAVSTSHRHAERLATNLLRRPRSNVSEIATYIDRHRDLVRGKYEEARREESTLGGAVGRAGRRTADRLGRLFGRAVDTAGDTRIGRELQLSAKTLILGTKAFYDLMDPDTDPLTWAMSHEAAVNQLMRESDEVLRMPGPSLTGKNTFIEDLADRAYEHSFNEQ